MLANDINIVIDKFWPHIFLLVEANYDLLHRVKIDGYHIETDNMKLGNKMSGTIILIYQQLDYKRLDQ